MDLTMVIGVAAATAAALMPVALIVYHKLFGASAPEPAGSTPAEQVISLIANTAVEILKSHANSAIKGSIGNLFGPALLKVAKQFVDGLEAATAAPAPQAPQK